MKSSNIYQKLKSAGAFGKKEEGPKLNVGVKSPLNMKKPSPTKIAPVVAAVGKKVLAGAAKKAIGAVASKVGDKVGEKITGGSPAEMSHKKGHSAAKMAKKSPMKQREKQKTISEQSYEDELKRERRMPGFAEKPEGGVTRAAKEKTSKFKKDISTPKAKTLKKSPSKMAKKSPAKKALVGKQKNLPEHLKAKIKAAPGKMKKSAAKMMKKGPAKMKYKK
ncbi:MAG: hypothetical protein CMI74_02065 [Candidatus Pelagibacter sp.]|nr:hypothetical protein [Candidatus Pelagibacter sp.]|tara:strand:+ start:408 stop:1067 length:660 start_codon:yes stop_codon:yes gene_type:complete